MSKPTEDRQWIYQRSQHIPHTQAETIMKMFYFKADARKMLHLTQKDSEFLLYLHTVWWYCWRWSQFCIHSGTSPSGWHNRGRRTHCLHDTHLHLWREGEKLHLDSLGWRHSEKETVLDRKRISVHFDNTYLRNVCRPQWDDSLVHRRLCSCDRCRSLLCWYTSAQAGMELYRPRTHLYLTRKNIFSKSAHPVNVFSLGFRGDIKLTNTAADGVLNVTVWAPLLWVAAKRADCVGAKEVWSTVMGPQRTLIYVWNRKRGKKSSKMCFKWILFIIYIGLVLRFRWVFLL